IEADRARSIKTVLRDVRADNFLLTVRGFGMFARKQGTVVWAGVAPSPALLHLKEAVDAALAGAGLPPSTGRFTPHLTLARLKTGPSSALCAFLKGHAATPAGTFPVTAFSLFRSVLDPGGAVHTLEEDYPLMG
ncbi:MAG: RNA 2',3'-cyclic phosphodiesterase, partial [Deltaproteobacteria bacterium]|nr:RNA 2',3'-cyclic phosphodiesterase [Deltaproteobacteria bacterium]